MEALWCPSQLCKRRAVFLRRAMRDLSRRMRRMSPVTVNQKKRWRMGAGRLWWGAWWLIEQRQWGLSTWRKPWFTPLWLWWTLCTVLEWRSPDCIYQLSQLLNVGVVGEGRGGRLSLFYMRLAHGHPFEALTPTNPSALSCPGPSSLYTSHGGLLPDPQRTGFFMGWELRSHEVFST